jgi:gliding motility-associated-like protein
MKTHFRLLFCLMLCCQLSQGQKENNIWAFGRGFGLDFSSGSPLRTGTASNTVEGSAAVCDHTGKLLFYSDGFNAYTRMHRVMPNGAALLSDGSVTQAAAIVPFPGDSNRYYLFVLKRTGNIILRSYLNYSVVDMRLNEGLGDIVPGQKNITIDSILSEKMIIARAPGCGYWLLVHSGNQWEFHSFRISAAGLEPKAVVSVTDGIQDYFGIGEMKVSPDNTKIAVANWVSPGNTGSVELYDFDSVAGKVLNYRIIDSSSATAAYGLAFSPDGTKLYAGYGDDEPRKAYPLVQYNLAVLPDIAMVRATKTVLATVRPGMSWSGMRSYLGKIYVLRNGQLDVIGNPDANGIACNYQKDLISFETGFFGLGNPVPETIPVLTARQDTVACTELQYAGAAGKSWYQWSDGDTARIKKITPPSLLWLRSGEGECAYRVDTFNAVSNAFALELDQNLVVCEGSMARLDARLDGASYLWQGGEQTSSIQVTEPGKYWVQVTRGGCTLSDTAEVKRCVHCVAIPNTFSPDGNGINDRFRPLVSCPVSAYTLRIFNRYGQEIFTGTDPNTGWDGTFNGQKLELGTYYYIVQLQFDRAGAGKELYKGDIQLIR